MFIPQPQDRPVRNPKGGNWGNDTWDPSKTVINQAQLLLRVIFLMVLNLGQRLQRRNGTHVVACILGGGLIYGALMAESYLISELGLGKKMELVAYLVIDQATRLMTHWLQKRAQGRALKWWEVVLAMMGYTVGISSTVGVVWRLLWLLLEMLGRKLLEMW